MTLRTIWQFDCHRPSTGNQGPRPREPTSRSPSRCCRQHVLVHPACDVRVMAILMVWFLLCALFPQLPLAFPAYRTAKRSSTALCSRLICLDLGDLPTSRAIHSRGAGLRGMWTNPSIHFVKTGFHDPIERAFHGLGEIGEPSDTPSDMFAESNGGIL